MAAQGWITVPGKGKRWRDGSGKLTYMPPASAGVAAQLSAPVEAALNGAVDALNRYGVGITPAARAEYLGAPAASTDWRKNPDGSPRIGNAATADLIAGQNAAIKAYDTPAPGLTAPAPQVTPAVRARQEAVTTMAQQYAPQDYWKSQTGAALAEAAKSGPRAGEAGYAQRADIQAWIEANKNAPKGADGKNIVERFLEKQRAQGLLDASGGGEAFLGERVAMPVDAESAAQAARRGLVGFEGNALEQAQADVARLQAGERGEMISRAFSGRLSSPELDQLLAKYRVSGADLGAYADAFTMKPSDVAFNGTVNLSPGQGMSIGQRPIEAPEVRQHSLQAVAPAQPAQAASTGASGSLGMQPTSASASQVGVAPARSADPVNTPNPADELARLHLTRAARLGY